MLVEEYSPALPCPARSAWIRYSSTIAGGAGRSYRETVRTASGRWDGNLECLSWERGQVEKANLRSASWHLGPGGDEKEGFAMCSCPRQGGEGE